MDLSTGLEFSVCGNSKQRIRIESMRSNSANPRKRSLEPKVKKAPGKTPHGKSLSPREKLEAIERVSEGQSKASVARYIGVPESTLRGWCKSEKKIRAQIQNATPPENTEEVPSPGSSSSSANLSNISMERENDEELPSKRQKMATTPPIPSNDLHEFSRHIAAKLIREYATLPSRQYIPLCPGVNYDVLNMQNNPCYASQTLTPNTGAVGLVENGLQYTSKNYYPHFTNVAGYSGSLINQKREAALALAPAQIDVTKACSSRKSLPPAAEAPSALVPTSPRRSSDSTSCRIKTKPRKISRPATVNNGSTNSEVINTEVINTRTVNTITNPETNSTTVCSQIDAVISSDATNDRTVANSMVTNRQAMMMWTLRRKQIADSARLAGKKKTDDSGWIWDMYKSQGLPFKGLEDPAIPSIAARDENVSENNLVRVESAETNTAVSDTSNVELAGSSAEVAGSSTALAGSSTELAATAESVQESDSIAREALKSGEIFYNYLVNSKEKVTTFALTELRRTIESMKAKKWPTEESTFYKEDKKGGWNSKPNNL